MAFHNPKGRVNYEPNSWGDDGTAEQFIASCRQVRFWDRMPS